MRTWMMEELPELSHTINHTNSHANTKSTILVDILAITTMEHVHFVKDPQGPVDGVDQMEMMVQQVCLDFLARMDLQDHLENQDCQENLFIITVLNLELKEQEEVQVKMVFRDDQEHLELLDLKVMLVYLLMGFLVDQATLVHLDEMEKMDVLYFQEDQAGKEQRVREIFLWNSSNVNMHY